MDRNLLEKIIKRHREACSVWGNTYHSTHEAYGVLIEEVDEVFQLVKQKSPSVEGLKYEILDCIAVLIKFYDTVDLASHAKE